MITDDDDMSVPNPHTREGRLWGRQAVIVVVAVAVVVVILLLIGRSRAGTGDPGGRILAQIAPAATAVPTGVKLNYENRDEPHMDSCDGRSSTRGWGDVVVQVNFDWSGSPQQVLMTVDQNLQARGWTRTLGGQLNFEPAQSWEKQLSNRTTAGASLSSEPDGKTWTLLAEALPEGKRASGC